MTRAFPLTFLCSLLLMTTVSHAQWNIVQGEFERSHLLRQHHYGFSLYDLDSGKTVFSHHGTHYFTPASNTKVYTLYTALTHIGDSIPGLQYVERGDSLIFWGTGDPTFLHPELDNGRVYNFLKSTDKNLFYLAQENPEGTFRNGWAMEDYNYAYQRDITPFPIYGNLVVFKAESGKMVTAPRYFEQTLSLMTHHKGKFYVKRHLGANLFELYGSVPTQLSMAKPFVWSDTLFVKLLADTLAKPVQMLHMETTRPSADSVRTLYSTSRNTLLREMMLPSDNFLAEQLTMISAYNKYGAFVTNLLREEMISEYSSRFGEGVILSDGSGLSVYNKVTPHNMISLLIALREQIGDEYALRMFFPAGGVDGTLKNAYCIDGSGPFVWAKTGTLHSVYCQSGYIYTKSGRTLAFSFLNNNFRGSASPVRREVSRLITFIHAKL